MVIMSTAEGLQWIRIDMYIRLLAQKLNRTTKL